VALRDLLGVGSPPKQVPYPGPFHDPDPTANQTALTHYLTANEALFSVNVMFNLHTRLYAIAQNSLKVLKLLGMVYPEAEDLTEPEFAQFTIIADKPFAFPKRQIADRDLYLGFPTSRTERPRTQVSPWVPGNTPIDFLVSAGGAPGDTVATYGLTLWVAQALGDPASELLQVNRNLDADRGYKHECWKIRDRSSITDDPVGVEILGYNQI